MTICSGNQIASSQCSQTQSNTPDCSSHGVGDNAIKGHHILRTSHIKRMVPVPHQSRIPRFQIKMRSNIFLVCIVSSVLVYLIVIASVFVRVHQLDPASQVKTDSSQQGHHRLLDVPKKNAHTVPDGSPHDEVTQDQPSERSKSGMGDSSRKTAFTNNESNTLQEKLSDLKIQLDEKTRKVQQKQEEEKKVVPAKPAHSKPKMMRPNFQPNPHGHMVAPEVILPGTGDGGNKVTVDSSLSRIRAIPTNQILTAYLEPIDRSDWTTFPLPVREVSAEDLTETRYPRLNSCSRLPEQWPVDDYPDADPFLPWIHDVFPTDDGKFIQFIAQNKRRCRTGTTDEEEEIRDHMAPQAALFQHIPLKKLETSTDATPRYRLSSHEDADPDSVATRFICQFKPSGDVTFSVFNNDYEWVSLRKSQRYMFHENGRDNKQIHTSQLLFKCPVPDNLVETIRAGTSVVDDWASIFIDLIPVRTPPRYGPPAEFLVPSYAKSLSTTFQTTFDADQAWGTNHVLPKFEDSGRWANIPVCKPSLMTYEPDVLEGPKRDEKFKHHLVSCLWASTGYTTRGNRYAINDGQRRLLEWISFNKILGFDHFYIFDNSAAFTNHSSLQPVADLFPGLVTVIKWPSRVCNNNPNNVDSVGERSSQYAAESSCRLRFGPHVNWIGCVDVDSLSNSLLDSLRILIVAFVAFLL
jgi:hypothetical protein